MFWCDAYCYRTYTKTNFPIYLVDLTGKQAITARGQRTRLYIRSGDLAWPPARPRIRIFKTAEAEQVTVINSANGLAHTQLTHVLYIAWYAQKVASDTHYDTKMCTGKIWTAGGNVEQINSTTQTDSMLLESENQFKVRGNCPDFISARVITHVQTTFPYVLHIWVLEFMKKTHDELFASACSLHGLYGVKTDFFFFGEIRSDICAIR